MSKTLQLNDFTFTVEVLNSQIPVLVDFGASWCGPCKAIEPMINEISNEFEGRIKVGKIDVDSSQQTAINYGIRSMPTLMIFKNGNVVDTIIGAVPKQIIVDKIKAQLN